jgi:hypothetical protein
MSKNRRACAQSTERQVTPSSPQCSREGVEELKQLLAFDRATEHPEKIAQRRDYTTLTSGVFLA